MEKIWYKSWPEGLPYSLDYPTQSLPELLTTQIERAPAKTAIIYYGRAISYGELGQMVDNLAAALLDLGVKKGERVSILLDTSPNFVIAFYAILKIGAVVVAANPMFKEWELEHELNDARIEYIIASDQLYNLLQTVREHMPLKTIILTSLSDFLPAAPTLPVHPALLTPRKIYPGTYDLLDLIQTTNGQQWVLPKLPPIDIYQDLALLQYTSGTTGMPKGAMISHFNLLSVVVGSATWNSIGSDDINISNLPFFHVTGMVHSMAIPLYTGGTMIILSRFDVAALVQAISDYRATCWTGIATMNIAVVNYPELDKYRLDSLRRCKSGGAPIPLEILNRFKALTGATLLEGYGLSETISTITGNPVNQPKLGTVGIPFFGVDCRIVDLEDPEQEVPLGQEGELVFKGPQVMQGYWNRPEATAEVLKDGWLRTGDIGQMDADGYITIVGRSKELIKASGYSVFPSEVEAFLYLHEAVREVAVIGVPDPYRGETIKAYVVLKPEYVGRVTEQELLEWSRKRMAAYKAPRLLEFRTELPHGGSGKLLKRLLAAEARASLALSQD